MYLLLIYISNFGDLGPLCCELSAVAFTLGFDLLFKLWSTNVQNQENYVKKENNQEEEEFFSFSSNL